MSFFEQPTVQNPEIHFSHTKWREASCFSLSFFPNRWFRGVISCQNNCISIACREDNVFWIKVQYWPLFYGYCLNYAGTGKTQFTLNQTEPDFAMHFKDVVERVREIPLSHWTENPLSLANIWLLSWMDTICIHSRFRWLYSSHWWYQLQLWWKHSLFICQSVLTFKERLS